MGQVLTVLFPCTHGPTDPPRDDGPRAVDPDRRQDRRSGGRSRYRRDPYRFRTVPQGHEALHQGENTCGSSEADLRGTKKLQPVVPWNVIHRFIPEEASSVCAVNMNSKTHAMIHRSLYVQ